MNTTARKSITSSMILLLAMMLFAAFSQTLFVANAQLDATVIIAPSIGGTTDPVPGTYTYANGTNFILTAIPDSGYTFLYWVISGNFTPGHGPSTPTYIVDENGTIIGEIPRQGTQSYDSLVITQNPANISHGYGFTFEYQAVFMQTSPSPSPAPSSNTTAIVIIEPSTGGTTDPAPGLHEYQNGTQFILTATPASGYEFKYWVISGNVTPGHLNTQVSYIFDENGTYVVFPRPDYTGIDTLVMTQNPANVSHGYGYTYVYQAVFAPVAVTPTPTPTATETPTATPTPTESPSPSPTSGGGLSTEWIIAIVVIVIIIIAIIAAVMMRRKK